MFAGVPLRLRLPLSKDNCSADFSHKYGQFMPKFQEVLQN